MKRNWFVEVLAVILLFFIVGCGSDDEVSSESEVDYPSDTIELYVPANPGGGTDASARLMSKHIQKYLDEEVVIINEDGGGGSLAMENVRTAEPNGYTLLYFHQALHTGYATGALEYEATTLTPIGTYSAVNMALAVNSDSPWSTLDEFIEDAKANPGEYSFDVQTGGSTHFHAAMLGREAEIELKINDGGTGSERVASLLGGHTDMTVVSTTEAREYSESGDFNILAMMSEERDPLAPDIPTALEQGYDIVLPLTHTLFGPADLPEEVVKVLNEATDKLAEDEEYNEELQNIGQNHELRNAEETTDMVENDLDIIMQLSEDLGF